MEAATDSTQRLIALGAELLAFGYAGASQTGELVDAALRESGNVETAPVAYLWYCDGPPGVSASMAWPPSQVQAGPFEPNCLWPVSR